MYSYGLLVHTVYVDSNNCSLWTTGIATYLRTEVTRIRISDDYNHSPNSKLYIILLTNEIIQLVLIVKWYVVSLSQLKWNIAKQRHFSWSAWERKIEQMVDNYNFSICLWYIFWKLKPNNELCLLICYFEYLSFKICDIKDWEINTGVREYINLWHRMEKESSVLNLDSCTTGFTK